MGMTLASSPELLVLIQRNDPTAARQLFEAYYGKLAAIAQRYSKNHSQAEEMLNVGFANCLAVIRHNRGNTISDPEQFIEKVFISECIHFIKNIRSEYYVASTVYASEAAPKNYDLFADNELIDFKHVDNDILLKSLQQLVPSQRLIFNLHIIEGYSLEEAAAMIESSVQTVKSNLEKARYNLQKNIENCLKSVKI